MRFKNPKVRYRRLMLVYSLAILIPGAILSVMAFRGLHGNTSSAEKLRNERLASKSQFFFDILEHSVTDQLQVFSPDKVLWNEGFLMLPKMGPAMDAVRKGLVVAAVGLQPDSAIKMLDKTTLFVPDNFWKDTFRPGSQQFELVGCQDIEFKFQDVLLASLKYQKLSYSATNRSIKMEAMLGEARTLVKLKEYAKSRRLYQEIFNLAKETGIRDNTVTEVRTAMGKIILTWFENPARNSGARTPDLLALEVLAFLGIPQVHLTESNYETIFKATRKLYLLEVRSSPLNKQYTHLIDSVFKIREAEIDQNRIVTKMMDLIRKRLISKSEGKFRNGASLFPYSEDSLSFVVAFSLSKPEKIAVVLNTKELIRGNIKTLEEGRGFAGKISWRILDESNNTLFSDPGFNEKAAAYTTTPSGLGFWSLQLQEEKMGWLGLVWEAGQEVYLIGFLFVILVMLLGLTFTLRGLTTEYRLTKLKSDFVSTITHEFKSPVTSIRQMSEMLSRDRVRSESRKKDYYLRMLAQSERLTHLVDNILDFSIIEEGSKNYNFQSCDLETVIAEIIEILKLRYQDAGFDLDLQIRDDLPLVRIDCDSIQQVFYNIIDNAFKYSGASRRIEIRLWKTEKEIAASVQDFGLGISKKDQRRIFTRFYRSEMASAKGIQGSGVGLSIVARIVKAHVGRVEISSDIGKGSKFTVYLPIDVIKAP